MMIFLTGMPASGKSTLGKDFAKKYGYIFIDLDRLIEVREEKSIAEIITAQGEARFRTIEQQVLKEVINTGGERVIVACGGGTACFHDNMERMNSAGITVYIHVSINTLCRRLIKQNRLQQRPLLKSGSLKKKLSGLFRARIAHYLKAKIHLKAPHTKPLNLLLSLGLQ